MSNITTLEQAKRLKKLGFSLSCANYYTTEHEDILYTDIPSDHNTLGRYSNKRQSAPTIPEALDWIREEFNLMCGIHPAMRPSTTIDNPKWASYKWSIMEYNRDVETGMNEVQYIERNEWFDTHHLAEFALLDAVLTYLENKGGE